jgi:hypothetical protein
MILKRDSKLGNLSVFLFFFFSEMSKFCVQIATYKQVFGFQYIYIYIYICSSRLPNIYKDA